MMLARDVGLDPAIALRMEPLRLALQGTADRMQDGMMRAAVSSIAREGGDCAAALFLPDGRLLAQARSLPLLLGSLIPAVAGVLARFPLVAMSEGDAYLLTIHGLAAPTCRTSSWCTPFSTTAR